MSRKRIRLIVAGLDLSLTGAGVAIIDPRAWELDVRRIVTSRYGISLKGSNETADHAARADRLVFLADQIVECLRAHAVTNVWVEGYSFAMQHNAHQLGEIGGVVKAAVRARLGLVVTPVSNSTARKLFLGRGAGKGIKDEVARQLALLGWTASGDEGDAAIIANYGLSELGLPALSVAR